MQLIPAALATFRIGRFGRLREFLQQRVGVDLLVIFDITFLEIGQLRRPRQILGCDHDFVTSTEVLVEFQEFQRVLLIEIDETLR